MTFVQVADIDVFDDLADRGQRLAGQENRGSEERLRIRLIDCGDSHAKAEVERSVVEPHPIPMEMCAEVGHPHSVSTLSDMGWLTAAPGMLRRHLDEDQGKTIRVAHGHLEQAPRF
jgi:hypothetical protein